MRFALPGWFVTLLVFRLLAPERGFDDLGVIAVWNALFAVGLAVWLLVLAAGVGLKVGGWLGLAHLPALDRLVFATALGLGVVSYSVTFLAILGALNTWAIGFVLLGWSGWSGDVVGNVFVLFRQVFGKTVPAIKDGIVVAQRLVMAGIFLLAFVQSLAPPWSYDALMYHLEAPRRFLEAGAFVPLPDIWQGNGPFTVNMLYVIGLAFGSDVFARLVHLSLGGLLVTGTYALGRRIGGNAAGWRGMLILAGTPILPVWFSFAYQDAGWALFELLGVLAVVGNRELGSGKHRKYLLLGGVMMGFAAGSKYLALGGVGVLGLYVLWAGRKQGWGVLRDALAFGGMTAAVGAVWYLKNWVLLGNPVFPVWFGGPGWDAARLRLFDAYHLDRFGMGRGVLDYLLLPWRVYARYERFTSFLGSIEIPSLLFSLALFYPLVRRKTPLLTELAVLAAARFALWALGSQQVRFMLPFFPLLAVLSGEVLWQAAGRLGARPRRVLVNGLLSGFVLVTLVYQGIFLFQTRPLDVIVGRETKAQFLSRVGTNYAVMDFVSENLPPEARVLLIQDGRGYYCRARCLLDTDHSYWTLLATRSPDLDSLRAALQQQGITHLLFSVPDADFVLQRDPTGEHTRALQVFDRFRKACLEEIYRDKYVVLFAIRCR